MRIGLIFAQELIEGSSLRALVPVGGRTLAQHQLEVLLGQGSQRIICFAAQITQDILVLQHRCEAAGARFHLLHNTRGLIPLVTADDLVVALQDGLFLAPQSAAAYLDDSSWVSCQPVEQGLARGFERIDLNHAAAGIMQLRGGLVARLSDLAEDVDVYSALQRIALQAAVRLKPLAPDPQDLVPPVLIRNSDQASQLEAQWIDMQTRLAVDASPSERLTRALVRTIGPALLDSPGGLGAVTGGAVVLGLLAIGSGWAGYPVIGLLFAAISGVVWTMRELSCRILGGTAIRSLANKSAAYRLVLDLILLLLVAWILAGAELKLTPGQLFTPLLMLAVLRLVEAVVPPAWRGWVADRTVLTLVLAGAAALQVTSPAVQAITLGAALLGIVLVRGKSRLTQP